MNRLQRMKLEEIFNRIQTQWDNARTKEEAEEIESWTAEKFIFFDKDFKG